MEVLRVTEGDVDPLVAAEFLLFAWVVDESTSCTGEGRHDGGAGDAKDVVLTDVKAFCRDDGGAQCGDGGQAAGIEDVATVGHDMDVDHDAPDLLAGNDAEGFHVDAAGLTNAAVHHAPEFDGFRAGGAGFVLHVGNGSEFRAAHERTLRGSVRPRGPKFELDASIDDGAAPGDLRGTFGVVEQANLEVHGTTLPAAAAVDALVVCGEAFNLLPKEVGDGGCHQASPPS